MKLITYGVSAKDKRPLVQFMLEALRSRGCKILHAPALNRAPFRITFETPEGERMGVIAYAFFANNEVITNRPADEHRFQIKYSAQKNAPIIEVFQDPFGLYTTVYLGINPDQDFFVAVDPEVHSTSVWSTSIEFKQDDVDRVLGKGWHSWERTKRSDGGDPRPPDDRFAEKEVLVGGTKDRFLDLVRFERAAYLEDPGHRQFIAEMPAVIAVPKGASAGLNSQVTLPFSISTHSLCQEFEMSEGDVLNLIDSARQLKMAVRGWVAERKLHLALKQVDGVEDCQALGKLSGPDIALRYRDVPLTVECKNVLRTLYADGKMKLDLQRTRAAKGDPCSRYYRPSEFSLVAACLHSVTSSWEFRYALPASLDEHQRCPGRINNNVKIDDRWMEAAEQALRKAAAVPSSVQRR